LNLKVTLNILYWAFEANKRQKTTESRLNLLSQYEQDQLSSAVSDMDWGDSQQKKNFLRNKSYGIQEFDKSNKNQRTL
jgi:hypothetical protein